MGLPGIVVPIASGLVLGPVTGVIALTLPQAELSELIGLGVAIILFKVGMDLTLGEFKRVGHGIGRLTIAGPPLAWVLGSVAAHYRWRTGSNPVRPAQGRGCRLCAGRPGRLGHGRDGAPGRNARTTEGAGAGGAGAGGAGAGGVLGQQPGAA